MGKLGGVKPSGLFDRTVRRAASQAIRKRARRELSAVSRSVRTSGLTYLSDRKLWNLEDCVKAVGENGVRGMLLEAGIALGGSAIVIATLMPPDRRFHGYDVFGMIPPPSLNDDEHSHERYQAIASGRSAGINGNRYYGYEEDLYEKVVGNFAAHGLEVDSVRVCLHKGRFEDTMKFDDQPIALAHLDCDWYESVMTCLERIYPSLSPGGFIISDDYYNYGGCARAIDEFLGTHSDIRRLDDGRGEPDGFTNLVLRKD